MIAVIGLEEYQCREKQVRADYYELLGKEGADRKLLRTGAIKQTEALGYAPVRAQAEVARWR